jgi:hypothetical protein
LAVDRAKPVQNSRCLWIGGQLSTLVAAEVGEEGQPPLEAAKYHHPCRGDTISGRGRDGHGLRHRLARTPSGIQPCRQLPQRIGVQVHDVHPVSIASPDGQQIECGSPFQAG